ncbi:MAG TPA: AzlD domain-containing protein [Symbiobacteriaceae bacterium]|nr:AzlD domain-containing protein [Symbiobacteriaceae bacterium]
MNSRDLVIVAGMILAVYLPKALPLLLLKGRLSPGVERWLKYVAPAVLSAMVAPAILVPDGRLAVPAWAQAPFLVTLVVTLFSRRMFAGVAAGLVTLLAVTISIS